MNNSTNFAAPLANRSVIRIAGADRRDFLQGLISNDIAKATGSAAIHAALLTPQGKFLHDLFILDHEDAFLVDCESARADDLIKRLTAYKLRSKVSFENLADVYDLWAVWGGEFQAPLAFADPRLPQLGFRAFVKKGEAPASAQLTGFTAYDNRRLICGVADGSRDMEIEKSTLAEGNFDLLNGIDWKKGCYVGQELTARMHYRGLAKKRLFPVQIVGDVGAATAITLNGAETGQLRSRQGGYGMALLPIDIADQQTPLSCGNGTVLPFRPGWMKIDAKLVNR